MSQKRIYFFDEGVTDKKLLGGKGAGLCEMTSLGLRVPPGFVITTSMCEEFYSNGQTLPPGLMTEVLAAVRRIESLTDKTFGSESKPLLVSVRSGAPISMPGMMDTILNLGLNDKVVDGMARLTGNERFAYDSYRRFIQLFGKIVLGVDEGEFARVLDAEKVRRSVVSDSLLDAESLKRVVKSYKELCESRGSRLSQEPERQLELAIEAVFRSWMGKRAIEYRRQYKITPDQARGTAVAVVVMIFGNMGKDSATGVLFTRDPTSGQPGLYGDYLTNAQGEDVVAGIRTPVPIRELEREMPQNYKELDKIARSLENHYREPQDIEFTIERGQLYVLQTRAAKMGPAATVKAAVDMADEGVISRETAIKRVAPRTA